MKIACEILELNLKGLLILLSISVFWWGKWKSLTTARYMMTIVISRFLSPVQEEASVLPKWVLASQMR